MYGTNKNISGKIGKVVAKAKLHNFTSKPLQLKTGGVISPKTVSKLLLITEIMRIVKTSGEKWEKIDNDYYVGEPPYFTIEPNQSLQVGMNEEEKDEVQLLIKESHEEISKWESENEETKATQRKLTSLGKLSVKIKLEDNLPKDKALETVDSIMEQFEQFELLYSLSSINNSEEDIDKIKKRASGIQADIKKWESQYQSYDFLDAVKKDCNVIVRKVKHNNMSIADAENILYGFNGWVEMLSIIVNPPKKQSNTK